MAYDARGYYIPDAAIRNRAEYLDGLVTTTTTLAPTTTTTSAPTTTTTTSAPTTTTEAGTTTTTATTTGVSFSSTDTPGVDISNDYLLNGTEEMVL